MWQEIAAIVIVILAGIHLAVRFTRRSLKKSSGCETGCGRCQAPAESTIVQIAPFHNRSGESV